MEDNKKHIKLKTIFMGTSFFGEEILRAILNENYNIIAVYTKPDAKAGRKQEVAENAVSIILYRRYFHIADNAPGPGRRVLRPGVALVGPVDSQHQVNNILVANRAAI